MMWPVRILLVMAILGVLFAGCVVWGTYGVYGVGIFDQVVGVESPKPIAKVWYANVEMNESTRYFLARDPEPKHFDAEGPVALVDGRFTASIRLTTGPALWDGPFYRPDLIVLAEFADGTRGCEAVEVTKGIGKEPVVVRFR